MVERRRRCRLKIRVMMQINAFQRLDRGPEEPGGVGQGTPACIAQVIAVCFSVCGVARMSAFLQTVPHAVLIDTTRLPRYSTTQPLLRPAAIFQRRAALSSFLGIRAGGLRFAVSRISSALR